MAIKGDLQDISLANLVQILCMEQRKAILNLKRRGLEDEGIIYFEDGQIVHALAGPLAGEEAVYHLLGWADGTFKVSNHATIPNRTIIASWSHLLMEGLRLVDEQNIQHTGQAQVKEPLSTIEIEQDNMLENNLILLLSKLEQLQTKLAHKKSLKRPTLALQILTEIINEVVAYSETLPSAAVSSDSLTKALAKASDRYATIELLRIQGNRLSTEIVSQLYGSWTGDPGERRNVFAEISQGMLDILETYFAYFTTCFRSSSIAGQWHETCQVFLAELRQEVKKIQF